MARKYYLDKRFIVNGKNSRIDMDNAVELSGYVGEVIEDYDFTAIIDDYITLNPVNEFSVSTTDVTAALLDSAQYVQATGTAAPITVTLPNAANVTGREFIVQANDITGDVTVDTDGGNINGSPSIVLTAQYDYIRVISDGTNYFIVGSVITP